MSWLILLFCVTISYDAKFLGGDFHLSPSLDETLIDCESVCHQHCLLMIERILSCCSQIMIQNRTTLHTSFHRDRVKIAKHVVNQFA